MAKSEKKKWPYESYDPGELPNPVRWEFHQVPAGSTEEKKYDRSPYSQLVARLERLVQVYKRELHTGRNLDGDRISPHTKKEREFLLKTYENDLEDLRLQANALPQPWDAALRRPYPRDDIFLNTPALRVEDGTLVASLQQEASGVRPAERVVWPGILADWNDPRSGVPQFVPTGAAVRGVLAAGFTSRPFELATVPLLDLALQRWIDCGHPGPLHPLTVATLVTAPHPRSWRTVAIAVSKEIQPQLDEIVPYLTMDHAAQKKLKRAGRQDRLIVDRVTLTYVMRVQEGRPWSEIHTASNASRSTVQADLDRIHDAIRWSVVYRCEELVRDAARESDDLREYMHYGRKLGRAWLQHQSQIHANFGALAPD